MAQLKPGAPASATRRSIGGGGRGGARNVARRGGAKGGAKAGASRKPQTTQTVVQRIHLRSLPSLAPYSCLSFMTGHKPRNKSLCVAAENADRLARIEIRARKIRAQAKGSLAES